MALSTLPLSYCTNVHPGRSVAEVEAGLDRYTVPVRDRWGQPLAAGLWLARPVVNELLGSADGLTRFAEGLHQRGLTCHTLNAFPYGDFHSTRVKENVYLPDWSTPERLEYTVQCARVLAELLPAGGDGSISTLPLGFKGFEHSPDFLDRCANRFVEAGIQLDQLRDKTGKTIRLAIEPEPLCVIETTAEAIDFFRRLQHHADKAQCVDICHTHLGLCYDVCHQAVEFENVGESIFALEEAGIRINKIHLSCAVQLDHPAHNAEGRAALRHYIEPRYLHQTLARAKGGKIVRETDLNEAFISSPSAEFESAPAWRIHFHVPVDAHRLGPLSTTRLELVKALTAIAELDIAPHLEVETYTWDVLPDAGPMNLVEGLTNELVSAQKLINEARAAQG